MGNLIVLGLQGAMHAGKSTVRTVLVDDYGAKFVSMSKPLKDGLMGMGATLAEVSNHKAEPSELWGGRTTRYAMQTIGTEWGRDMIHPDIWVNCVRRMINKIDAGRANKAKPLIVVIDDVRFPNEFDLVHSLGGQVWTIRRPDVEPSRFKQWLLRRLGWRVGGFLSRIHRSERWWMVPASRPDHVVWNTVSKGELGTSARYMAEHELGVRQT